MGPRMIGSELRHDDRLSLAERAYVTLFGIPINGLRIRARRVLPLVEGKCGRILDAGCGQGILTIEMARLSPESWVTGIDISSDLIERNGSLISKLGISNVDFKLMNILDLEFRECFDAVVSVDNLEHIKDDDMALNQFRQALKPGGELIIHVPCMFRRWFFLKWCQNFDVLGHCRPGYTMDQIRRKLERAGFRVVEGWHTFGWLENVSNNFSYLITKAEMRRKLLYALVFPVLEAIAWLGRNSRPNLGAGILIKAVRD